MLSTLRFHISILLIASLIAVAGGCAKRAASPPEARLPITTGEVEMARQSFATLYPPEPLPAPATQPAEPAPLESLELFARARRAMLDGHRSIAMDLLEQAARIDPYSFEIKYLLAQAILGNNVSNERSIEILEEAVRLRPEHLAARVLLGRQYLARSQPDHALRHLVIASRTREYDRDDDAAAVTDFFLARALQARGFHAAALERFERLERRLRTGSLAIRTNPELNYLAARPELLYVQMAELHEAVGSPAEALRLYRAAAARDPASFELQARQVGPLLELGRQEQAKRLVSELVARFRASSESLELLRETYRRMGREGEVVKELQELRQKHPDDRSILFTYAQVLRSEGRSADAKAELEQALRKNEDIEILRRLIALELDDDNTAGAAARMIESLARRPDLLRQIQPMWTEVIEPGRKNRLRISDLQKVEVSPAAEAAKLYMVARLADLWNRDLLARSSLEKAVQHEPIFPPAYRSLLHSMLARPDWDEKQKLEFAESLIERVRSRGDTTLATELRGRILLWQGDAQAAVEELSRAANVENVEPDLAVTFASALLAAGQGSSAEKVLWKLIADRPTYDEAYVSLFGYYLRQGDLRQAERVLTTWLENDPGSVGARMLQASVLAQTRRFDAAQRVVDSLFADSASNLEVLLTMRQVAVLSGKKSELITRLQTEVERRPHNRSAVMLLVEMLSEAGRPAEASRVLDASRAAAGKDPDLLYYLAHLYTRIGQKQMTEEVLQQVLEIDPLHAPASNDLGYQWADDGRNLDRAEQLIRVAVAAEPDNQSFLDSLGWVLYKRGKFEEARRRLEEAIGSAARPDPVVLDHLGDTLYRLGDEKASVEQWQRAWRRLIEIDSDREDLKALRIQLNNKLRAVEKGQQVEVAPVVESAGAKVQAEKG